MARRRLATSTDFSSLELWTRRSFRDRSVRWGWVILWWWISSTSIRDLHALNVSDRFSTSFSSLLFPGFECCFFQVLRLFQCRGGEFGGLPSKFDSSSPNKPLYTFPHFSYAISSVYTKTPNVSLTIIYAALVVVLASWTMLARAGTGLSEKTTTMMNRVKKLDFSMLVNTTLLKLRK